MPGSGAARIAAMTESPGVLQDLKSGAAVTTVGAYELGPIIGEGTFGKVKLGHHRLTNTPVAVKIVDKLHAPVVAREIDTWRRMHHANIAQLYEVLTTENKIYMVTEYVSGGELFDHVTNHGAMAEPDARRVFNQLLLAIQYCHDRHFVHRDLKLENVMLDEQMNVKIIDFGFTRNFGGPRAKLLDTYCGSTAYAAPEMVSGKRYSGPAADVWSLGVILYTLVVGYLPFDDDNESVIYSKILAVDYDKQPMGNLSADLRRLIAEILVLEPDKRLTVRAMLAHPWLQSDSGNSDDKEESGGVAISVTATGISSTSTSNNNVPPPSDHFSTPEESELLLSMASIGLDGAAIEQSVRQDACDHLGALFHLLLRRRRDNLNSSSSQLINTSNTSNNSNNSSDSTETTALQPHTGSMSNLFLSANTNKAAAILSQRRASGSEAMFATGRTTTQLKVNTGQAMARSGDSLTARSSINNNHNSSQYQSMSPMSAPIRGTHSMESQLHDTQQQQQLQQNQSRRALFREVPERWALQQPPTRRTSKLWSRQSSFDAASMSSAGINLQQKRQQHRRRVEEEPEEEEEEETDEKSETKHDHQRATITED